MPTGRSEQCSRASVSPVCAAERSGTPRRRRGQRGLGTHRPARPPAPSPARRGCRPRRGPAAGMCSAQRNVPNHSQMCAVARPPPPLRPTGVAAGHRGPRTAPPRGCPRGQTGYWPDPARLRGRACPAASGCRGLAGRGQWSGQESGVPGRGQGVPAGRGCVLSIPIPPRPHSPHPAWGPVPVWWGHAGSRPRCPAGAQPSGTGLSDGIWVPAVTAAGGAVPATWRLCKKSAGEDRRRPGRRGHRGHRRGDTGPPPHAGGRVRVASHGGLPAVRPGAARPRGHGTCVPERGDTVTRVRERGDGVPRPLRAAAAPAAGRAVGVWVSQDVPGVLAPADTSPSRGPPATALPAPRRAVMNSSGGSSGTHAAESVCAIDFSSTAAESGAGAGAATGTPARGSHVPTPQGHVPHATPLSSSPPAQLGRPGDNARTGDPPASPWGAQHGRLDPGVAPCVATTLPSTTAVTGRAGDGAVGGTWGIWAPRCPPASPPRHCGHTRCQPLPFTHRHRGSTPWGCVTATGPVQCRMRPLWPLGSTGPLQAARAHPSSAQGYGDAGTRSAPRPGDGWQRHGP